MGVKMSIADRIQQAELANHEFTGIILIYIQDILGYGGSWTISKINELLTRKQKSTLTTEEQTELSTMKSFYNALSTDAEKAVYYGLVEKAGLLLQTDLIDITEYNIFVGISS